MVNSIEVLVRLYMRGVKCDNTVKEMEGVISKYKDNHGKIMYQLMEKMFRIDAATKRHHARELAELHGNSFSHWKNVRSRHS